MSTTLGAIAAIFVINSIFLLVSNIACNSTPQPLTKDEELKYFQLLKQGDEEAFSILLERNLDVIDSIIKKFKIIDTDKENLITIGIIGLIKAIHTYDDKKLSFNLYASDCIEREIEKHYINCDNKNHRDS
jgi:RNA polymerase sporulation-specific sigma factor